MTAARYASYVPMKEKLRPDADVRDRGSARPPVLQRNMPRRDWDDDDQIIIVEERDSSGLSAFLLGTALGAGLALIFAPQSGAETRQSIKRSARKAGDATKRAGEKVTDALGQAKADLKADIEVRIDSAKSSIDLKKTQVSRAVDAGREAARAAREELEHRMAEQRAADASRTRDHEPESGEA